ncbi:MAG: N-acetyltransferase family protein [Thermoplasmata archaeon]
MGVNSERSEEARTHSLDRVPITGLDRQAPVDLSPWFNPFLPHFVRETVRSGGEVWGVLEDGNLTALTLKDPAENVASLFTRNQALAEELVRARGVSAAYSDFRMDGPVEAFGIYSRALGPVGVEHAFRHRVRPISEADLPRVAELMREVQGNIDDRWFHGLATTPETGFLIEVEGRLAGVGWVAVLGRHARLHSLAVRPGYRHVGVGADLLGARLLWAHRAGASEVLSEIADRNAASRYIAESAGMRRVGEIYLYPPGEGVPGP